MDIAAGALFANLSGTVSGAGVWLGADDIVHATAVLRDQYDNGFADRAQQSARIEARGDLTLDAARSITATGAELEAGGGLRITAGEGVMVEYHKTGSLDASLAQLAQSPGLEWVETLRADPSVDWRGVEAAFEQWDTGRGV